MKLRYKIANGILIFLGLSVLSLGLVLGHTSDCEPAPSQSDLMETMKAVVSRCYGSAELLTIEDVAKPAPAQGEVLVKIVAASVNPLDWHYMRGSPYLMRLGSGIGAPSDASMGVDFAGTVEAVGSGVKRYKPGDEVFGGRSGAFAEYVVVSEDRAIAMKPPNMTFQQAAAVPIAGITALQALRDNGNLQRGQKVLINGASGGVGTFAVQIAKSMDAEVTAVCSKESAELVRSLGASHVIDYTEDDFTKRAERYNVIFQIAGSASARACRRALEAKGRLVLCSGDGGGKVFGPIPRILAAVAMSPFVSQRVKVYVAKAGSENLEALTALIDDGHLTPVIDATYPLAEAADAVRRFGHGHGPGKIVLTV
jgi:NADPH:quinone reductase-like Zn-dependent oxidoreductase